ncbi:MAG: anion permease, partial [Flavobacteriaceae bacterium]|nr:anion permease [Flavobacteriaceae bacterium]
GIIIGLYLVTLLLTSFVTHIAAVSIVFPIAFAMGAGIPGLNMAAVFVAIAFAASASFHAPFSYQTNLMIYGPGGYKFKDFLKVGLPFSLIYSVLVITFILVYYKI